MIGDTNINDAERRISDAFNLLPLEKTGINLKVRSLFQGMHYFRLVTIEDDMYKLEDPAYRDNSLNTGNFNNIYIAPIWSLFKKDAILQFKIWLLEQCLKKNKDINTIKVIIPDFSKGIFSPKTCKLVDETYIDKCNMVERTNVGNLITIISSLIDN